VSQSLRQGQEYESLWFVLDRIDACIADHAHHFELWWASVTEPGAYRVVRAEEVARGLLTDSPTQLAIADIPAYVLTPTAMRFSYIGVFVEGIYEVPLPYTQLAAIINPMGALARFLPKQ
jgi:hypothetical protein